MNIIRPSTNPKIYIPRIESFWTYGKDVLVPEDYSKKPETVLVDTHVGFENIYPGTMITSFSFAHNCYMFAGLTVNDYHLDTNKNIIPDSYCSAAIIPCFFSDKKEMDNFAVCGSTYKNARSKDEIRKAYGMISSDRVILLLPSQLLHTIRACNAKIITKYIGINKRSMKVLPSSYFDGKVGK